MIERSINLEDIRDQLLSRWFVIHSRSDEIRPCLTMEELMQRDHGEWRSWMKIAHATLTWTPFFGPRDVEMRTEVSTVFLGLDHGWSMVPQPPVLFETMIFGGPLDDEQWRYCTKEEAIQGHRRAVAMAKLAHWIGGKWAMKIVEYCYRNTIKDAF